MNKHQQGSVIIITLWTVTLLTILVTVIASQNRLTARAAFYHQEELGIWANVLAAVNQAEMELMLSRMPMPPETVVDLSEEVGMNPLLRFNGDPLELSYPAEEDITVRIYDHKGKINLREISRPRFRALLEKKIGDDQDDRIDRLIAAWGDWRDLSDGEGVNGAEVDYYQSLDVPYVPRNGRMETVDEILHIRGFAEVFGDVDLEAAFTLYTEDELVNLNLATVEAMELLPGLNQELIEEIVAWRQDNEFRGNGDVAQIVPQENMVELRSWLNNRETSNFFTIMAYRPVREEGAEAAGGETAAAGRDIGTNAFSEVVELRTATQRPRVLKVDPYGTIPRRMTAPTDNE